MIKYIKMEISVCGALRKGRIYPAFLRHLTECTTELKILFMSISLERLHYK